MKVTYSEMMDPKMGIYFSSYGEDVEDVDILIYFRCMIDQSQFLVKICMRLGANNRF